MESSIRGSLTKTYYVDDPDSQTYHENSSSNQNSEYRLEEEHVPLQNIEMDQSLSINAHEESLQIQNAFHDISNLNDQSSHNTSLVQSNLDAKYEKQSSPSHFQSVSYHRPNTATLL